MDFVLPGIEESHDEDRATTGYRLEELTEDAQEINSTASDVDDNTLYNTDIDDNTLYDTDIELEDETVPPEIEEDKEDQAIGREEYKRSCSRLNINPEDKVITHLDNSILCLKHQGLGEDGAKALAKTLMRNTKVEKVELNDNCITPTGVTFISDMLCDNIYITYLDLSENDVGTFGCAALKEMLLWNSTLLHLILQDCKIKDSDCAVLAEGVQRSESLVYLDLSHNELREDGAMSLGNAISINNSVEQLNLSWNHIRRRGAVQICKGLRRNYCLVKVDLSWNGLGYDGALSLGQALRVNKYLRELDVSSNRLTWNCASVIAAGLKDNDNLEVLKIGLNPLTMTGALELLNSVNNKHSELEYMGLDGVPINRKIAYIAEMISNKREFSVSHGGVIDTDDIIGKKIIPEEDPLTRLMAFLNDRGVRPVDLFRSFEKGADKTVSKEQFIAGLKKALVPLETWEMVKIIERLDKTEEGKINYKKLNLGFKEQKLTNKIKDDKEKAAAREKRKKERKLMNPEFSSNAANSIKESLSNPGSIASASRRASRISLSVTQSIADLGRPGSVSQYSSRSAARTPRLSLSRNPALDSLVSRRKSSARESEIQRKLSRVGV